MATPADVLKLVKDGGFEFVDLRFCDLPGQVQHVTLPVTRLNAESLEEGFGFDGSSIRGFQQIQESDMVLVPDPDTAVADPFREAPTLILYCFVKDPLTAPVLRQGPPLRGQEGGGLPRLQRRRRHLLLRARGRVLHLRLGPLRPEPALRLLLRGLGGGCLELGEDEPGGNKAYKPGYKEGYFPVPPTDHFADLRSEMTRRLRAAGIEIEVHHHEVGTAGQSEIGIRYGTLLRTADNVTLFKYIVKNTAWLYGKTVTFMPKPIFQDNGSGMHVHMSLWTGSKPLFYDEKGYAGLSDHGPVLHRRSAGPRPGDPGLRRSDDQLLPAAGAGVRGAGQPGLQPAEPVGGGPHPGVLAEAGGQAGRVPLPGPLRQPLPGLCHPAAGRPGRDRPEPGPGPSGGQGPLRPASRGVGQGAVGARIARRARSTPSRRITTSCSPAGCSPRS